VPGNGDGRLSRGALLMGADFGRGARVQGTGDVARSWDVKGPREQPRDKRLFGVWRKRLKKAMDLKRGKVKKKQDGFFRWGGGKTAI